MISTGLAVISYNVRALIEGLSHLQAGALDLLYLNLLLRSQFQ
jgi:hypothetical protein